MLNANTPVQSQDGLRLNCLIVGEYTVFEVTAGRDHSISVLKNDIRSCGTQGTLKDVDAKDLELWKVDINLIGRTKHTLRDLKIEDEDTELSEWEPILEYWPEQPPNRHLHIKVKLPISVPPTVNKRPEHPASVGDTDSFIQMKEDWEFNGNTLTLNAIHVTESFERYNIEILNKYRRDLQKMRAIHPKFNDNLIHALGIDCFNELYDLQKCDESPTCEFEMRHMNLVVAKERDNLVERRWKEKEAYCIFFGDFTRYFTTYMKNLSPSFGFGSDSWPYTLVVYRDDIEGSTLPVYTKYEPRSDFFAVLQGIPRIITEVKSNTKEDDEKRMLVQGASLVRLINKALVQIGYKPDYILMAIYFDYMVIMRYLLCQGDEIGEGDKKEVYCFKEQFSNNQQDRARLLQQMYNLASKEEDVDKLNKLQNKLKTSSQQVRGFQSYTSMRRLPKRTRGDDKTDQSAKKNRTQNNQNAPFAADGYELVGRVPALMGNVYIVRRCRDRKQLIAKVTRDSVEEEILEFLHTRESPCEYIIPLIGCFSSNKGPGILLPIRQPVLPLLARPERHRSRFLQFGEDLIKGLAFIHSHCVAHRDIKPDNLVYTDTFLLQIIDFDAATHVLDSDDLLDEEVGTNGYIAPETRDRHSPIRADRWSCGLMIVRFLECSDGEGRQYKRMEEFARRLTDRDPWCRPSLCEWMELSKDKRDEDNAMEESPRKKRRVEDYETEFQSNTGFMMQPAAMIQPLPVMAR